MKLLSSFSPRMMLHEASTAVTGGGDIRCIEVDFVKGLAGGEGNRVPLEDQPLYGEKQDVKWWLWP